LYRYNEASPNQVKQIAASAAAAVASYIKTPDDAVADAEADAEAEAAAGAAAKGGGGGGGGAEEAATSTERRQSLLQSQDEEVPFVPGDDDAPEGLYRAILIKPPQIGNDHSGASFMDLIRNAALAAKAGMLDDVGKGKGDKKGGRGGGGGDEDEKTIGGKRNPAWLTKQINRAIRGEGRWPWWGCVHVECS
jgi:hypothetical protein